MTIWLRALGSDSGIEIHRIWMRQTSRAGSISLVLSFGVNVPFQKQPDPGSTPRTTFARSILAYIESKARSKCELHRSLTLRQSRNKHARKLYEDLGFKYDANGSFDDDGLETFEMRKWFAS